MQNSMQKFFEKDAVLISSAACGIILWLVNAGFNVVSGDWMSFFINLFYVICLFMVAFASLRGDGSLAQSMITALITVCVIGNVAVLAEMIEEKIPSRNLWQLIVGLILTIALFINHCMLTSERQRSLKRITFNHLLVLLLLAFRVYQIVLNVSAGRITLLMIEVSVGMLALIPTLETIVCIEYREGHYSVQDH